MSNLLQSDNELEVEMHEQIVATSYLVKLYEKFGLNENMTYHDFVGKDEDYTRQNITSPQWKFIDAILKVWRALYPEEYSTFVSELKEELTIERSVREHVTGGGYQPVSYPIRFYDMCKLFFPKLKIQDKEFVRKFVRLFPEFKATKYRI